MLPAEELFAGGVVAGCLLAVGAPVALVVVLGVMVWGGWAAAAASNAPSPGRAAARRRSADRASAQRRAAASAAWAPPAGPDEWARQLTDAEEAAARFAGAAGDVPRGPLRHRLGAMRRDVSRGVERASGLAQN